VLRLPFCCAMCLTRGCCAQVFNVLATTAGWSPSGQRSFDIQLPSYNRSMPFVYGNYFTWTTAGPGTYGPDTAIVSFNYYALATAGEYIIRGDNSRQAGGVPMQFVATAVIQTDAQFSRQVGTISATAPAVFSQAVQAKPSRSMPSLCSGSALAGCVMLTAADTFSSLAYAVRRITVTLTFDSPFLNS
jgi:hypothetical protein